MSFKDRKQINYLSNNCKVVYISTTVQVICQLQLESTAFKIQGVWKIFSNLDQDTL